MCLTEFFINPFGLPLEPTAINKIISSICSIGSITSAMVAPTLFSCKVEGLKPLLHLYIIHEWMGFG